MKYCTACKETKEYKFFSKDKNRLDGYYNYCKDCVKNSNAKRYLREKDKIIKNNKKWKEENKEYYLQQQRDYKKEYIKTPSHKYREYKTGAIERNYCFEISMDQFMTFWSKPCFYCNSKIETIGIDRADNDIGYVMENLVPCCFKCNRGKDTQNSQEYIDHCIRVAELHRKNKI